MVYSLGTVINANNSNNKTSLAITTTTTNNYVHLILLSSCLLSASYPARFFHSRLFNTDLLAHFGFFSLFPPCSACYCWYCCCCCCRCLRRRRRPRRLILLEHNFNFCYVANTTERTHILFLFSFFSFAVPHTASTLFYLFDLVANPSIGSMSRPPVLDSIGHLALSTSSRILEVFSTDQHLCGHFLNTHTSQNTLDPTGFAILSPRWSKLGVSSTTSLFLLCYCRRHHLSWSASLLHPARSDCLLRHFFYCFFSYSSS